MNGFARSAYPVVAGLFAACAVLQVFLAGLGVFDDPASFITHRNFGYLFGWLTLVLLALALAGRLPRRFAGVAGLLLLLFALQSVFVVMRTDMPAIAALHPLNGFAILGLAIYVTRSSWAYRGSRSAVSPGVLVDGSPSAATEPAR